PSGRMTSNSRTQSRRRTLPFQSNPTPSSNRTGKKTALPLKTGMSQSKKGLTSDWLMKSNSLASSVCSQCIADTVAESGKLKTQLRDCQVRFRWDSHGSSLRISKNDDGADRPSLQLVAAVQEFQFDEKADFQDVGAEFLHQRGG